MDLPDMNAKVNSNTESWLDKVSQILRENEGVMLSSDDKEVLDGLEDQLIKWTRDYDLSVAQDEIMRKERTVMVPQPFKLFSLWPWTCDDTDPSSEEPAKESASKHSATVGEPFVLCKTMWEDNVEAAGKFISEGDVVQMPSVNSTMEETLKVLLSKLSLRLLDLAGPKIKGMVDGWPVPNAEIRASLTEKLIELAQVVLLSLPEFLSGQMTAETFAVKVAGECMRKTLSLATDLKSSNVQIASLLAAIHIEDISKLMLVVSEIPNQALSILSSETFALVNH